MSNKNYNLTIGAVAYAVVLEATAGGYDVTVDGNSVGSITDTDGGYTADVEDATERKRLYDAARDALNAHVESEADDVSARRSAAARKAWATRRGPDWVAPEPTPELTPEELAAKRSEAARKAWATRRGPDWTPPEPAPELTPEEQAERRSEAAKRAWATRKANAAAAAEAAGETEGDSAETAEAEAA